jgi:CheY-like chemotaxis protein
MDGREVLARIKANDSLKVIPTVILTTSQAQADVVKSYQLRANCYLNKPTQLEAFESLVKASMIFGQRQSCRPLCRQFDPPPSLPIGEVSITANCPRRIANNYSDQCGACCLDLVGAVL